ncbi:hypothetical protein J3Q64DRAFT_1758410 [Phycomyces blakesleeanus]|uniref:MIT domain-containing protein n=1 Tax=Phycomyces blakesleeanus TaxID=4837 RepID=A0ABR3ARM4_PHYBL
MYDPFLHIPASRPSSLSTPRPTTKRPVITSTKSTKTAKNSKNLEQAIEKANTAVQFDTKGQRKDARKTYKEAIVLLESVLQTVSNEDKKRLQKIHDSYTERIHFLSTAVTTIRPPSKVVVVPEVVTPSHSVFTSVFARHAPARPKGPPAILPAPQKPSASTPLVSERPSKPWRNGAASKNRYSSDVEQALEKAKKESLVISALPPLPTSSPGQDVMPSIEANRPNIIRHKTSTLLRSKPAPTPSRSKSVSTHTPPNPKNIGPVPTASISIARATSTNLALVGSFIKSHTTRTKKITHPPNPTITTTTKNTTTAPASTTENTAPPHSTLTNTETSPRPRSNSNASTLSSFPIRTLSRTTSTSTFVINPKIVLEDKPNPAVFLDSVNNTPFNNDVPLMKRLHKSIEYGGYITATIHAPKQLWHQSNVRLPEVSAKVTACKLLVPVLKSMEVRRHVSPVDAYTELSGFEHTLKHIKYTFAKKLGILDHIPPEVTSDDASIPGLNSSRRSQTIVSWGNKISKSVERMKIESSKSSEEQYMAYIDILAQLFSAAQVLDDWKEFYTLEQMAPDKAGLYDHVLEKLQLCTDSFHRIICAFVMRDFSILLNQWLKKSLEWVES